VKIREASTEKHGSNYVQWLVQTMTELNYMKYACEKFHELSDLCLSQVKELQKEEQR